MKLNVRQGSNQDNKVVITKDLLTGEITVQTPQNFNSTDQFMQQCNSLPPEKQANAKEAQDSKKSAEKQSTASSQKSKSGTKAKKSKSKSADAWSSLVDYNPEIGMGMRTKRHLFPPGDELVFEDGEFHTDECLRRRYHQHTIKDHYMLLTGNFNEEIHSEFSIYDPG